MAEEKKAPAKRGRKKIEINIDEVEKHSARGLTKNDIADALGIVKETLYRRMAADPKIEQAIRRGRAKFKIYNSDVLIMQARNGNVAAAIWLDKTRCGMKEPTNEQRQSEAAPVKIIYEAQ